MGSDVTQLTVLLCFNVIISSIGAVYSYLNYSRSLREVPQLRKEIESLRKRIDMDEHSIQGLQAFVCLLADKE